MDNLCDRCLSHIFREDLQINLWQSPKPNSDQGRCRPTEGERLFFTVTRSSVASGVALNCPFCSLLSNLLSRERELREDVEGVRVAEQRQQSKPDTDNLELPMKMFFKFLESLPSSPKVYKLYITEEWEDSRLWAYKVSALAGSAGADFTRGRPLETDFSNPRALAQAKSWVKECSANHESCKALRPVSMPTRLLQISEDGRALKLGLTNEQYLPYVALSYPWGGKIDSMTTTDSISARSEWFPKVLLPQTIQDAVRVAYELDISYLWVDCFCIIQDSKEDKRREIAKMGDIYSNSYITVAATNAHSAYSGFLNHRYTDSESLRLPFFFPNKQVDYLYVRPDHLYCGWVLKTRAWALEERVLARRLLDYEDEKFAWRCLESFTWDDDHKKSYSAEADQLELIRLLGASHESTRVSLQEIRRFWSYILGEYTTRQLTKEQDKLTALGGLAARFHQNLGGEYVAGLWSQTLAQGLLWSGFCSNRGQNSERQGSAWDDPTILHRSPTYRAPSWSWASVEGMVDSWYWSLDSMGFDASIRHFTSSDSITLEITGYHIVLESPAVPYGHVTGGSIAVNGYMRELVLSPEIETDLIVTIEGHCLDVQPDDAAEWVTAMDYTVVTLLEIVRRNEKSTEASTRHSICSAFSPGGNSTGSEVSLSTGLILTGLRGGTYKRLAYFLQTSSSSSKNLFEDSSRRDAILE